MAWGDRRLPPSGAVQGGSLHCVPLPLAGRIGARDGACAAAKVGRGNFVDQREDEQRVTRGMRLRAWTRSLRERFGRGARAPFAPAMTLLVRRAGSCTILQPVSVQLRWTWMQGRVEAQR